MHSLFTRPSGPGAVTSGCVESIACDNSLHLPNFHSAEFAVVKLESVAHRGFLQWSASLIFRTAFQLTSCEVPNFLMLSGNMDFRILRRNRSEYTILSEHF